MVPDGRFVVVKLNVVPAIRLFVHSGTPFVRKVTLPVALLASRPLFCTEAMKVTGCCQALVWAEDASNREEVVWVISTEPVKPVTV